MIEIRDVSKRYDTALVVDGVSLTLPKGGVTSIIGPNGAGKSTLLSMISRLLPIDTGSVTIDGLDVTRTPGDVLARRLSILRQDNAMTVRLTVRDLVAFGRYPHSKGRMTVVDRQKIEEALAYLALEPLADSFLDEISGGQRQRAFVAMVLAQDTDVMLFDEPLNNLDIRHAAGMMRLIRKATADLDKTVMVVLHDINFASCHSDRIIAMKDGKVFAEGPPAQIVTRKVLEPLYETTFDVRTIDGKAIAFYFA
ncbi:ATP-binding cassette domain-containing protein [Rhizobium sp. NFR03]|uniref:iron ABC transporter ATP-binding protein n=1 Tax=Rhizobium sp. NFR03 TaxID=1566263 RepID=UPI0008C555D5|nr:ATP-binding cassette domain-containing protein [Rhizobium sp. NFR03]SES25002.1 iron complex transport system ATP-binding protein [Rhizobium sp. NFR03]